MSDTLEVVSTGPEETRATCEEALRHDDLREVERGLRRAGRAPASCSSVAASVTEAPGGARAVRDLEATLHGVGAQPRPGALERYLLLRSCTEVVDVVPSLPVPDRVRQLLYEAFRLMAAPPEWLADDFRHGEYPFSALCKLATLRRFPAGQFDWEISGIPRSYFLRVRPRELPRMLAWTARRIGGLRPLLTPHFSLFRRHVLVLREREVSRSYHLMARALELQPGLRGMVATSWFYSPDTYRVSPHLSWLRATIVGNGGFSATLGAAGADSGVLVGSASRRGLFESGAFRPTDGLVIWPRAAMIRWALGHPQYAQ